MERRTFLKLSAMGGTGFALEGCSEKANQIIRFIPDEVLVPGVAVWRPSICTQCSAGCGILVRVMEGDAEVVRKGQFGVVRMGLAKKLEGSPQHPVNHGKLCPRGHAGLQVTYNPDRIQQPLTRVGQRGSGKFAEISWDDAIRELVSRLSPLIPQQNSKSLAFVTSPLRGVRGALVHKFLSGFQNGQMISFEFFDEAVLRRANQLSFGYNQLPTFDLARSSYVISFGADFLGTWNSPVAQNLAYGAMRQERSGIRGKFVQVEARMSQTGANADEWIPAKPGTEADLVLGLAHVILTERLRQLETPNALGTRFKGWREGLPDYSPTAVAWKTGVPPETITRLARELAAQTPSVAIVGGAPLAQTNGLFAALAVNALNDLLGSIGNPGGMLFSPSLSSHLLSSGDAPADQSFASVRSLSRQIMTGQPRAIDVLLLYGANPVFATPPGWQVREAFGKVPFIASFGSFIDETSRFADLILPDHSYLESWMDDVPESGTTNAVVSVVPPAMRPLHDTRAMPDVLLDLAAHLGGKISQVLPWKTYDKMLQAKLTKLRNSHGSISASSDDEFWKKLAEEGQWRGADASDAPKIKISTDSQYSVIHQEPEFDGASQQYPFHLLPYASQQFFDGRQANLPWMQEMPEVLSTAMWSTWVEINPQTAASLKIDQGDLVEVTSAHGKLQAPALLSPGIAPDVLAIPIGQGHEEYGRYATGRGANPITILAPLVEPVTGALAWAGTRVNVTRAGKGELILFSGGPTEWSQQKANR